jgi:hypothetical protein
MSKPEKILRCGWCGGTGRGEAGVCDGCGGSGMRRACRRGDCAEYGCGGYGDCKVDEREREVTP